jgi:hypothetical protein
MFLCAGNKKKGGRAHFDEPVESDRSPVFYMYLLGAGLNPHLGIFYSNQKLSANRVFVKDGWFEIAELIG